MHMKALVVGLGLIGGSIAKAMKAKTSDIVWGIDRSKETLEMALECGAIDQAVSTVDADVDLILLALYPNDSIDFIRQNLHLIPRGCLVIDLCGVKRKVCHEIEALLQGTDVIFIGGHPMAGKENSGFAHADAALFEGASMILTPSPTISRNHCLLAELFFQRLGFTHITYTTPEKHDEIIALTSQLAHIVSSAYVQNPSAESYTGFSAGSFRDMTRVAKLHEGMWTELFLGNADYLSQQLTHLLETLHRFQTAIDTRDAQTIYQLLQNGRRIKEAFEQAEN